MRIGIIVARFQSPHLHEGHTGLIKYVAARNDSVVIFLGTTETKLTKSNPLNYETRKQMVLASFPNVTVHPIPDCKSNRAWNVMLDQLIDDNYTGDIVLYGSRDSFITHYKGKYRHEVFQEIPSVSATRIRSACNDFIQNEQVWREGIIYASNNRYPVSYQTVDIAVVDFDRKRILLGKKSGEEKYRFIGGFVDTNDESLEAAAKREVREECGDIETDEYEYLGSFRVDDWRYRKEEDKIMTAFFCCLYVFGHPKPTDDISTLDWFDLDTLTADMIEPEHQHLFNRLKKHLS